MRKEGMILSSKHRVRLLDRAIHAAAFVRYRMPDADLRRHGLRVVHDVRFGSTEDDAHRLDIYRPDTSAENLPCVLYVHGGGFGMLSKDTHRLMAVAFAKRGYVVFNANYRLGPKHAYPAPLEDAASAMYFVGKIAKDYGGNPSKIILSGESAGGNLVTALTVAQTFERPEPIAKAVFHDCPTITATIPTYGYLDVTDTDRLVAHPRLPIWTKRIIVGAARAYVGDDPASSFARAPLASPLRILESESPVRPLPPFFVACGTRDPLLSQSKRLVRAVHAHGGQAEFHLAVSEIHGFDAMIGRPAATLKWQRMHAFLSHVLVAP
jgi:acetyl esterase